LNWEFAKSKGENVLGRVGGPGGYQGEPLGGRQGDFGGMLSKGEVFELSLRRGRKNWSVCNRVSMQEVR